MAEKDDKTEVTKEKSKLNPKIFIIGVPLFIIQLVAVYMIAANLVISKMKADGTYVEEYTEEVADSTKEPKSSELGKFIYEMDDIIVNPAGTDGQRLLMASLGFDVASEEILKEMESKQIVLKDMIISTFSEKTLPELNQIGYKDSLKQIIISNIAGLMPKVKINTVYFSKYIIQ